MKELSFKTNLLISLCSSAEWFDFILFLYLSIPISNYFLPKSIPESNKHIITLGLLIIPYILRPVGGAILGSIADSINKGKVFISTIVLMIISTVVLVITPGYDVFGYYSILILLLCRMIQSFSIGGEFIISSVILLENSKKGHSNFMTSFVNFGTVLGSLIAYLCVSLINSSFTEIQVTNFYWKIPVIISLMLFIVVFFLRYRYKDIYTSLDNIVKNDNKGHQTIIKLFFLFLYLSFGGVGYYFFVVMGKYILINTGLSQSSSSLIMVIGLIALLIGIPISGYLADRFDSIKVQIAGVLFILCFAFAYKYMLLQENLILSVICQIIFGFGLSLYLGVLPAFIASVFNNNHRCLLLGLGYNLSLSIFGASTPLIIALLLQKYNYADVLYLTLTGVLSLSALIYFHINRNDNTYPALIS